MVTGDTQMQTATFNAAIEWIALNDDECAGDADHPLVSESLVADLFDTTTDHVCECVARFRAYVARGKNPPRMKTMNARDRAARKAVAA